MRKITLSGDAVYKGSLILVNSGHPCREAACEVPLVPVDDKNPAALLERQSARLLDKLMDETGVRGKIVAVSGWRSESEQIRIYEDSLAENGREFTQKYVAMPGCSEHQTGLAIDLAENKPDIDFIRPDFPYEGICRRFREKASAFGFVERYPKGREDVTGIGWEPWHFRYVGFPHAAIMQQQGMTLEEYHAFLKKHEYGINPFVYRINGRRIEISYLKSGKDGTSSLEVNDDVLCMVSGNNMDGFIITVWW
ncbi:MAG: M15 family metallopeptidase [Clostridiales bacterium]|jgi:D-alanyl-D-alanine dipeptidase/carboxypeptidase|nr:M15 family metallopeptidase [Clostridiales bacterium]